MTKLNLGDVLELPDGELYEVWAIDRTNYRIMLRPARKVPEPPKKSWLDRLLGR